MHDGARGEAAIMLAFAATENGWPMIEAVGRTLVKACWAEKAVSEAEFFEILSACLFVGKEALHVD
jgi:hypothetical protein